MFRLLLLVRPQSKRTVKFLICFNKMFYKLFPKLLPVFLVEHFEKTITETLIQEKISTFYNGKFTIISMVLNLLELQNYHKPL